MADRHLLATDGSDVSLEAIDYARSRLNSETDSLLVLGVSDESQLVPYVLGDESTAGGFDLQEIRRTLEDRAEDAVKQAVDRLEGDGFTVEGRTEFGDPGELICEVAAREDVETIIMGRRGHSTVGELLLGSTSQYVVHHSDRPVTLVPMRQEST